MMANALTLRGVGALERAGGSALFAADEFFSARIRNPHTRRAYARAVGRFLSWIEAEGVELGRVTPGMAGRFIDQLPGGPGVRQQALAACRQFCSGLVQRHAMILNPFLSVAGERHQVIEGRTPEITISQARQLLASIDTSRLVGLRDRALYGMLCYTGARIGSVLALRRRDVADHCVRLLEKGGKDRTIPLRQDLEGWLLAWVEAAGIALPEAPLFQGVLRANTVAAAVTGRAFTADAARAQLKRRLKDAGLPGNLRPHSFRVLVVTDLLEQNVPLEDVQVLVGHSHPQTTQIYDRRKRRVSRSVVERISI